MVSGAPSMTKGRGRELGLSPYTPVLIKSRDEKTHQTVKPKELLR